MRGHGDLREGFDFVRTALQDFIRSEIGRTQPAALEEDGARVLAVDDEATVPAAARPVQMMEVAAAAGDGSSDIDESASKPAWFRRAWVENRGIDPTQAALISVHGDSMDPTLPDGSTILVDRARRRRHEGRIYVLRIANGLLVKRAGRAGRDWILTSDNASPNWPDIPWPAGTDIVGEVRWVARDL